MEWLSNEIREFGNYGGVKNQFSWWIQSSGGVDGGFGVDGDGDGG